MDSTLNITPEESLSDLPAATGCDTNLWKEQQIPEDSGIEMRGTQPSTTMLDQTEDSLYLCEGGTRKNTQWPKG